MNAGELNVHFINSVLATVIVAFFVLWRYRQAILGGMMRGDPVALPASGSSDGSAAKPPARPDEDAAPVAG